MILPRTLGFVFVIMLGITAFGPAHAHPVPYKGAWGLMSFNSPEMSELTLVHSFTSQVAAATTYLKKSESEFYFARLNWLAKRWNNEDSQANIYLSAGVGAENYRTESQTAGLAGLGMDWESRRYYVLFDHLYLHRDHPRNPMIPNQGYGYYKFRIGTAPFLAEYDELNVWLIFQAEKYSGRNETNGVELTQMLRFYIKNSLWEIGARLNGGWVFNYMVHF